MRLNEFDNNEVLEFDELPIFVGVNSDTPQVERIYQPEDCVFLMQSRTTLYVYVGAWFKHCAEDRGAWNQLIMHGQIPDRLDCVGAANARKYALI